MLEGFYLDDPPEFRHADPPVVVDIEDPEDLPQVLLGGAVGHDVEDDHELFEVNVAVLASGGRLNKEKLGKVAQRRTRRDDGHEALKSISLSRVGGGINMR